MTTTTLARGGFARPSSALLDRLRQGLAARLDDARGNRAYRRQERALGCLDGPQRAEVLMTARRG
jgi:hypothetical protein